MRRGSSTLNRQAEYASDTALISSVRLSDLSPILPLRLSACTCHSYFEPSFLLQQQLAQSFWQLTYSYSQLLNLHDRRSIPTFHRLAPQLKLFTNSPQLWKLPQQKCILLNCDCEPFQHLQHLQISSTLARLPLRVTVTVSVRVCDCVLAKTDLHNKCYIC